MLRTQYGGSAQYVKSSKAFPRFFTQTTTLAQVAGILFRRLMFRQLTSRAEKRRSTWGRAKWEQIAFLGNPEFGCDLHPIDFAAVARACGVAGYALSDPAQCAATLGEALDAPGPALIEATVDPNEPPLPPKATFEQTKNLVEALARGTPDAGQIARNIALGKIRELI